MKKTLFLFYAFCISMASYSQISKTINVTSAGTLSTLLNTAEKNTVTNLTISGVIDARDIKCLRDELTNLAVLDMSAVVVLSHTGADGTYPGTITYPANEMPLSSFLQQPNTPKLSLTSVILPSSLATIGSYAFAMCTNLNPQITIPASVTHIWNYAFWGCTGINKMSVLSTTPPITTATTFLTMNTPNCTLEVPLGLKSTYQKAENWSGFGLILENSFTTSIKTTQTFNNHYFIKKCNSQIEVEGTLSGEFIFIYSANGHLMKTVQSEGKPVILSLKRGQIYILKFNQRVEKIVM